MDKEGIAKKNLEMDVKEIQLVGGKPAEIPGHQTERSNQPPQRTENGSNDYQPQQTQKEVVDEMAGGFSDLDDSIPF